MKTALITGITGQDGSYLAELLIQKEYNVIGIARSNQYIHNIAHFLDKITLINGDIIDSSLMLSILKKHQPDEIYNLAAVSHIQDCWDSPQYSLQVNSQAPIQIIDAVGKLGLNSKVVQATSREIYGNYHGYMTETTPYSTENPYAVAKLYTHLMLDNYRRNYGLFTCSAILFNHESPRRPEKFVTRKVTKFAANAHKYPDRKLKLGSLGAKRDWGYAPDFVYGMWLMLQQEEPKDYLFATGSLYSVEDLCRLAFAHNNLDYRDFIEVDETFMRTNEVKAPVGDYTKAREELKWEPTVTFSHLLKIMVEADRDHNN